MIVDTSALLAIFFEEPEAKAFADVILARPPAGMAAPSWLEATIVVGGRRRPQELEGLGELLIELGIRVLTFTSEHAAEAVIAARRFGKGSGHRAQLNFGDCMSYGIAKASREALLFKGDDFPHTDITPALA